MATRNVLRLALLKAQGLRFAKHRQKCYRCKDLTKHVVGLGTKPRCADCITKKL